MTDSTTLLGDLFSDHEGGGVQPINQGAENPWGEDSCVSNMRDLSAQLYLARDCLARPFEMNGYMRKFLIIWRHLDSAGLTFYRPQAWQLW